MPPKQTTVGMLGIPSLFGGTPEMVMAYTIWQAMCGNGVMMRMKVMQILVCCAVALGLILRGSCGSPPAVGLLGCSQVLTSVFVVQKIESLSVYGF